MNPYDFYRVLKLPRFFSVQKKGGRKARKFKNPVKIDPSHSNIVFLLVYNSYFFLCIGKPFQCWQCLIWFPKKEDLKTHSCLLELKITGNIIYTCNFCAICSDELQTMRTHVQSCKKFSLAPLKCFKKFESAMTSTISTNNSLTPSRSRRKELSHPSKCDLCSLIFPSKSELVLHQSKRFCKSVKCEKCQKNFANERSLGNHVCEDVDANKDNAMGSGDSDYERVDQDIKVIKLDRGKILYQVNTMVLCCVFSSRENKLTKKGCGQ